MRKFSAISSQMSAVSVFLCAFVALLFCTSAFGVADSNLVAHYKMDDNAASTVVIDEKGNNGTSVRNTNLMHVDGKVGGAFEFDGTTDYVTIPNNEALNFGVNDFSICFWIKPIIKGDQTRILNKNGVTEAWLIDWGSGGEYNNRLTLEISAPNYGGFFTSVDLLPDNIWYFVSFVVNRTTNIGTAYVNAIAGTDSPDLFTNQSSQVYNTGDLEILQGFEAESATVLDNFMIFNKALSAAEVLQLYNDSNSIGRLDDRRGRNRY